MCVCIGEGADVALYTVGRGREKRRNSWMKPVWGVRLYVALGSGCVRESYHVLLGGGNPPHTLARDRHLRSFTNEKNPGLYTVGDVKETRWRPSY